MTLRLCGTAVTLLFLSLAPSAWSQQYFLYSPKPVSPEETKPAKDDVLVREVPVRKGDTLSGISREHSGRGSYYPQIMLFNDIKNPDLIHAGEILKVPVAREPGADAASGVPARKERRPAKTAGKARGEKSTPSVRQPAEPKPAAEAPTELPLSELKRAEGAKAGKQQKSAERKKQATPPVARSPLSSESPKPAADSRLLFEKAVKAYRQGDCRTALDLLDRFLAENPASPQAADASLYKADCYLKLSSQ